jgi:hypothetical protein
VWEENVMAKRVHLPALAAVLLASAPAAAAPISYSGTLTVEIVGVGAVPIPAAGSIDVSGSTYQISAGLVSHGTPITVPVTSTTSIDSLRAVGISNLAASLAAGGATTQIAGEVCATPAAGEACVAGGGIGGPMGITGVLEVVVLPSVVTVPIDLGLFYFGLGGSAAATTYSGDAGVWTTGTAFVNLGTTGGIPSRQGGTTPSGAINLVAGQFVFSGGNSLALFGTLSLAPVVPEPSTAVLLASAAGGLVALRRRRRQWSAGTTISRGRRAHPARGRKTS